MAAIGACLSLPEVVQAGQEGGFQGAATATGGIVIEAGVGIGTSAVVGYGTIGVAGAFGTTVTVGGTAVTGVIGATGVGGAVILAGTGGYALGNAIGQLEVGGQSVHDHIADGIIWGLDLVGLW